MVYYGIDFPLGWAALHYWLLTSLHSILEVDSSLYGQIIPCIILCHIMWTMLHAWGFYNWASSFYVGRYIALVDSYIIWSIYYLVDDLFPFTWWSWAVPLLRRELSLLYYIDHVCMMGVAIISYLWLVSFWLIDFAHCMEKTTHGFLLCPWY